MSEDTKSIISRRHIIKMGLGAVTVGFAGVASAQKIAPSMVQYQAKPNDGHQCSMCMQFVAPDSCKVVDGKISPTGWCAAFAPKS